MLTLLLQRVHKVASVAILVVLAVGAPSCEAAAFRTRFDPTFNTDFSGVVGVNVGWRGTASVTVDDVCVNPGSSVSFPNVCGTATLDGFLISFYNTTNDADLGLVAVLARWPFLRS